MVEEEARQFTETCTEVLVPQAIRTEPAQTDGDTTDMTATTQSFVSAQSKKRKNKKKTKLKKEFVAAWREKHVSPSHAQIMAIESQANLELENLNPAAKPLKEFLSENEGSQSKSSNASDADDGDSDEDFDDYHKDGYHPAHVNEIIDSRYILLKKLGWGHFSTVWLALKLQDKQLYALKIQKSAEKYIESALEEEEILYDVASNVKNPTWEKQVRKLTRDPAYQVTREDSHNVQMFDQFFHHSIYGKHSVMAFEVLGKNLLSTIKKYDYKGIPMAQVREITRQCLMGLDYLHRVCQIIHTDLKPENVVYGLSENQKFGLLNDYVLKTNLVDLFDSQEPIVLNKKQAKNQKKKERKKKQKAAQSIVHEDNSDPEEPPAKPQTKAQILMQKMRAKLDQEEQATRERYVLKLQRSKSAPHLTSASTKRSLYDAKQQAEDGLYVYEHELRSYKQYVAKYAKNNFELLKIKYGSNPDEYQKQLKKVKPYVHMRVRSQQRAYRTLELMDQLKPKTAQKIQKETTEMCFNIKLCDMGNACYVNQHYSDVIQTREYRSPEVLLQGEYDESADVWSLACMIFELVTGDYLFDPKKGSTFKKNDDHLALITELIGEMTFDETQHMADMCELWDDYYQPTNKNQTKFKLKRIKSLKSWPLIRVLVDKYRVKETEANMLSSFLLRMLKWCPKDRASARDLLEDPWLKLGHLDAKSSFMTRAYHSEWRRANGDSNSSSESEESGTSSGEEVTDSAAEQEESECSEEDYSEKVDEIQETYDCAQTSMNESKTQDLTLLNTVPDASGLNYNPRATLQASEQPLFNETIKQRVESPPRVQDDDELSQTK